MTLKFDFMKKSVDNVTQKNLAERRILPKKKHRVRIGMSNKAGKFSKSLIMKRAGFQFNSFQK